MRSVKINQDDLGKIRDLYESVMANACHGLFFKEGGILGKEIATAALQDKEKYFEVAAELLKDRGWVESVEFTEDGVKVKGSFEATGREGPTCHRLRGIIRELYERKSSTRVNCQEEECASTGKDYCRFLVKAA
jgi:predicted hydrocarbon binding protein